MKLVPTGCKTNDCVQTPFPLALAIVNHFKPTGTILEPCKGEGAFCAAFREYSKTQQICWRWMEILEGLDFLEGELLPDFDWIITNPPYSKLRAFLQQSMRKASNIVFLTTINHFWLKARIRDMREQNFDFKEIVLIDTPKNFPQSGFQMGCVHIAKNWCGDIKLSNLSY